jgi:UDP-N-acetylmuramate--alanine ligase
VGSWRRSEVIKTTQHGNILISDYGHHPSEIRPTLQALQEKYSDRKLYVVFQPHQYSRTRELLHEFAGAFGDADTLVIPNIYFSRDKQEDVEYMTVGRLIMTLEESHPNVINGGGLKHTAELIHDYDRANPESSVIVLLGAGDVDNLRYEIV